MGLNASRIDALQLFKSGYGMITVAIFEQRVPKESKRRTLLRRQRAKFLRARDRFRKTMGG